jgi:hypothetical protein
LDYLISDSDRHPVRIYQGKVGENTRFIWVDLKKKCLLFAGIAIKEKLSIFLAV